MEDLKRPIDDQPPAAETHPVAKKACLSASESCFKEPQAKELVAQTEKEIQHELKVTNRMQQEPKPTDDCKHAVVVVILSEELDGTQQFLVLQEQCDNLIWRGLSMSSCGGRCPYDSGSWPRSKMSQGLRAFVMDMLHKKEFYIHADGYSKELEISPNVKVVRVVCFPDWC
jgi:hypothetical protein